MLDQLKVFPTAEAWRFCPQNFQTSGYTALAVAIEEGHAKRRRRQNG
jgi:hypothetical protein